MNSKSPMPLSVPLESTLLISARLSRQPFPLACIHILSSLASCSSETLANICLQCKLIPASLSFWDSLWLPLTLISHTVLQFWLKIFCTVWNTSSVVLPLSLSLSLSLSLFFCLCSSLSYALSGFLPFELLSLMQKELTAFLFYIFFLRSQLETPWVNLSTKQNTRLDMRCVHIGWFMNTLSCS